MGQHMASLVVLPVEWTSTMRPLQDQCEPTPYEAVEALFQTDMGVSIADVFDEFDPVPIGVASLAQVHIGNHKESGKQVAVKVCPFFPKCYSSHRILRYATVATSSSCRVL